MTRLRSPVRRSARARRAKRNEGAVMLIVMLVIMMATAASAVSVASTQNEIYGVGRERMEMHARYGSEAAMNTTLAWFDKVGNNGEQLATLWALWRTQVAPELRAYGELPIPAAQTGRHDAARNGVGTHVGQIDGVAPINDAPELAPDFGGTPGTDRVGSFGPRQSYDPVPYVVDITDCVEAPSTLTPGTQIGGGGGGLVPRQFFCVFTSRGRIAVPGGITKVFDFNGHTTTNTPIQISGAMHDSRATILTPTMLLPPNSGS